MNRKKLRYHELPKSFKAAFKEIVTNVTKDQWPKWVREYQDQVQPLEPSKNKNGNEKAAAGRPSLEQPAAKEEPTLESPGCSQSNPGLHPKSTKQQGLNAFVALKI